MYISLAFEGAGAQLAVSTQASSLQVLKEPISTRRAAGPKSGVDFGGTLFSFGRGGRMGRREGRTRDGGGGGGGGGDTVDHSGIFLLPAVKLKPQAMG